MPNFHVFFLNFEHTKKIEIKQNSFFHHLLEACTVNLSAPCSLLLPIILMMVQSLPSALPTSTFLENYYTVVGANLLRGLAFPKQSVKIRAH